jgi:hypothetical protein
LCHFKTDFQKKNMENTINSIFKNKVDENTTVLLSGAIDSQRILVFLWTTMTYSLQVSKLIKGRAGGACALLKGSNGENLIAITGGASAGIEAWNPLDGSVKILNSTFPLANGYGPQMIAIKGNTELVLFESCTSIGDPKGIWKFSQVTNAWTKIGEMLTSRSKFSALPVDGVSCS